MATPSGGLTLQQLQGMGAKPVAPTPTPGAGQTLEQLQQQNQPAPEPSLLGKIGNDIADVGGQLKNRVGNAVQAEKDSISGKTTAPEAGLRIFTQLVGGANDVIGGTVKAGLQTANAATGGIAGLLANKAVAAVAKTPLGAIGLNSIQQGASQWDAFKTKYPGAAEDLQAIPEVGNFLLNFVGGAAAKEGVSVAATAAKDAVGKELSQVAVNSGKTALDKTISAVDPELTGNKLKDAYKEVVTKGRDVTPGGVIKPQELSPAAQSVKIGTRLHEAGIVLSGKPVQDLQTLGNALKNTEDKIGTLLKGSDPEVVYNADKPTLLTKLNEIKASTPREFNAIKDSKAVHDSVVDFAKEVVGKSDDTVQGLRDARTAFDAQARKEFPSAFKNGAIDDKTPAGRAIKAARNAINDHLYDTAPEGSEIKKLIGREADIFRATDSVAGRAKGLHGTSKTSQLLEAAKKHPYVVGGAALSEIGHRTIAPGLPGI